MSYASSSLFFYLAVHKSFFILLPPNEHYINKHIFKHYEKLIYQRQSFPWESIIINYVLSSLIIEGIYLLFLLIYAIGKDLVAH